MAIDGRENVGRRLRKEGKRVGRCERNRGRGVYKERGVSVEWVRRKREVGEEIEE